MKVVPLSLRLMTPSETMDLLFSEINGKNIIHYRKEQGNDLETIHYLEKEIQTILVTKEWPLKMKKPKK